MSIDSVTEPYAESLRRFLVDAKQAAALESALVEAEWDSDLDEGLRDALARIRLVLSEVAQQMRPAEELKIEIVRLLASLAADGLGYSPSTKVDIDLRGSAISYLVYSYDSSESQCVEVLSGEAPGTGVSTSPPLRTGRTQAANSLEEAQVISEPVIA